MLNDLNMHLGFEDSGGIGSINQKNCRVLQTWPECLVKRGEGLRKSQENFHFFSFDDLPKVIVKKIYKIGSQNS